MNPQPIDINQVPKQLSENVMVGANNEMFVIIPVVGTNATAYALTPEHAKRLSKLLAERVSDFEKKVRPITESTGVPSPIQTSDLPPNGKDDLKK